MMRFFRHAKTGGRERGWSLLETAVAIVVVGIGIALFLKVQKMSSRNSTTNSRILMAGKAIESFLEDTRISIAKDTLTNWPPVSKTVAAAAPNFIKIVSTVGPAYSPKDNALVANVVRMDIVTSWTTPYADTLKVTTYVSKRF